MKLDLGNETVIQDVQLWGSKEEAAKARLPPKALAQVVAYLDVRKIPLWVQCTPQLVCYSLSSTTAAYFRSKLLRKRHEHRGIVVAIEKAYFMFTKFQRTSVEVGVRCVPLNFALKPLLDSQIAAQTAAAAVPATPALEDFVTRQSRARAVSSSRISRHVQIADFRRHFASTASSCILGGLRLRGIPEKQNDSQQIYAATYGALEFAFREELAHADQPIAFEQIQETVETLLRVFTRS